MSSASERHDGESYYGRPIIKPPVWKPYVGWYFFTGGLAGGSSLLGLTARLSGNDRLARNASLLALAAVGASPPLLIADLGRPTRFLNMLRVFKPTSPMSVGTWILTASSLSNTVAAGCELLDIAPRARLVAEVTSAALAPALCTYTAVLVADTAVPVWHEARHELPMVFAGSAAASAGAAATLITRAHDAQPARRLVGLGAATELAATFAMQKRLGKLGEPYHNGTAGHYARAAKTLLTTGAALTVTAGCNRARQARIGAALALTGAACTRLAVLAAGTQSAADPSATVDPQRERVETRAATTS